LRTSTVSITEIEPAPAETTAITNNNSTGTAAGPTTSGTNTITTASSRPEFDYTEYITSYITITSYPGAIFTR
jgi:hypothetical protein